MTDGKGAAGYREVFSAVPAPCLLLDAQLRILDANAAYVQMVGRSLHELVDRYVFDAFPAGEDGVSVLETSMRQALATGRPDRLPLLKYDVEAEPGSGRFQERWWTLVNVPVLRADGTVFALVNAVEDVTEVMRERERSRREQQVSQDLRARTLVLEGDLYARTRELSSLATTASLTSRRLTALAEVALQLATAETLTALVEVVIGRGLSALGADGGGVGVRDDARRVLRLTLTESLGEQARHQYAELPLAGPLPACVAAREGRRVLLGDRDSAVAFAPEMAGVYATAGKVAWASLPLLVGSQLLGSVTASWDERRGASLEDGLSWLRTAAARHAEATLEELCDALLAGLQGTVEDDVVLLAVRAHPEHQPRPPDAGPQVLPDRLPAPVSGPSQQQRPRPGGR